MKRLKSYHFDLGNSNVGSVGFCARITANSKAEALLILRAALMEQQNIGYTMNGVEYIQLYINHDNITEKDIDEWDYIEH